MGMTRKGGRQGLQAINHATKQGRIGGWGDIFNKSPSLSSSGRICTSPSGLDFNKNPPYFTELPIKNVLGQNTMHPLNYPTEQGIIQFLDGPTLSQ